MTTVEDYIWIEKGCRVVVVTEGGPYGSKVQPDTVTSITERYVDTEKSGRFVRRNMRPVGAPEYTTTRVHVLRPDDPYIATARARIRLRNLGNRFSKTLGGFTGDHADALAVLDQIEQAVRDTRAALTPKGE